VEEKEFVSLAKVPPAGSRFFTRHSVYTPTTCASQARRPLQATRPFKYEATEPQGGEGARHDHPENHQSKSIDAST
jgi:hypothetical protein